MEKTLGKPLTKVILLSLLIKFALVVANISKGLEFFVIENFYKESNKEFHNNRKD